MRRRSRHGGLFASLLVIGVVYSYWEYMAYVLMAILVFVAIRLAIKTGKLIYTITQNLRLKDIDAMDGVSFERYVAQLLIEQGYVNVSLTEHYDYGVDIIADKDGVRWGIQVKRYSGLVKAEAVRQVVTGLRLYGCDRAMVITNSTYSNVARRLAEGNDCVLIDRSGISSLKRKYI